MPARRRPAPIPLTLVTGFLGAGKTTLLNRLLASPDFARTAVIVNEFGEIGLDHLLIEQAEDGIIELSAGCICCTVRGALADALERLFRAVDNRRRGAIDRILVETTGLADPVPILSLLMRHPYLPLRVRLEGVVTVVDAVSGMKTLDEFEEAVRQVAVADRVLLSKTDLAADTTALRRRIGRLAPAAPILEAGTATAGALFGIGPFAADAKGADVLRWLAAEDHGAADHGHDHEHDHGHGHGHDHDRDLDHHHGGEDVNRHDAHISAAAIIRESAMAEGALVAFLERLAAEQGETLLRVKGLIQIAGAPGRPAVVQGVRDAFAPVVRLAAWPDGDRRSRLVAIGRDLDKAAIERLFDIYLDLPRPDTPDRDALTRNPLAIPGFGGR